MTLIVKNMKAKTIIAIVILITMNVAASVLIPFEDWDQVFEKSPDIVVATCWNPTPPTPSVNRNGPGSDCQVEILSVLKGTNDATSVRLLTEHELQKGSTYLVLGQYNEQGLYALEDYRVIQLNKGFRLKSLDGKTLDEKIKILFQSGVDYMNQKIQEDNDERDRLKQALQK